jgi:adenylosuccinate synthase
MIKFADVIVDLQAGDTGKGKVANYLVENDSEYTHVIRYNGGGNAGHTFYHKNQKIVTHYIPLGVIHNKKSIIGPGCVINPKKLLGEITYLEEMGFDVRNNLLIDKRVHIVKEEYIEEDKNDSEIGTTKTGNGPTYRNKYNRTGLRAENCDELKDYIIDIYDELHGQNEVQILFEGAQGFELDIDWGDYPYVTSSHCTVGGAIMNGVPPQKIRDIYGIAKVYRTYVGSKSFEPNDPIFDRIRNEFGEFGATTGRPRQLNWLDMDTIIKSININGVTHLIFNKLDVLKSINEYKLILNDEIIGFDSCDKFMNKINDLIFKSCPLIYSVKFSESPYQI